MPNKGMSRVGAAIASLTMCAVMAGPAQALTDTAVDMSGRNVSFDTIFVNQPADDTDAMPDNPSMELPDEVSEDLPDDAVVVSPDLAVTEEGKIKDLETGETVTTEELVGTPDTQPDPLAKTNGESFIPVEVGEVKEAVKESEQTSSESGQTGGEAAAVRPIALEGNEYGAYWGTYNNTPAFFESDGTLFVQQAKGVIDVSEWQGEIDWEAAKNAGVEGAIIRISYGWNNGFDKYALRNISECKRLGIPFGIYSYSYSYDKATATAEGADIVSLLRKAGVSPNDLSYPVFYDLERWTWTGYTPPTDPAVYDEIVNAWYGQLQAAGYNNLSEYSYTSYLYGPLNSDNSHGKTRWVASYGQRTGFTYTSNNRGWQYTSGGTVAGITGRVDLNAFGNAVEAPVQDNTADDDNTDEEDSSDNAGDSSGGISTPDNPTGGGQTSPNWGNRYYFTNRMAAGESDAVVLYGKASDEVLSGDWDGDGRDSLAVRRGNTYYVKNEIAAGEADLVVSYGKADDAVLVGDWDGDGRHTFCVRRP